MNKGNSMFSKFFAVIYVALISTVFAQSQEVYDEKKDQAKQFVEISESRLQATGDNGQRFTLLSNLSSAALVSGDSNKAKKYALELKKVSDKFVLSSGRVTELNGLGLHISNSILGHLALDNGDTALAKEYLLASGDVNGNPAPLTSFGPEFSLAKRLFEKGERDTVIEYFDLCAKFWKMSDGRLEKWKASVAKNEMPDFGVKLSTLLSAWRAAK